MFLKKAKNTTAKGLMFAAAFSLFTAIPAFSSLAVDGNPITETAAGQETPVEESTSTPGAEQIGPAFQVPAPTSSQEQEIQEIGPGVTTPSETHNPDEPNWGAEMTNPVYPIVKEVDKYSYEQMEKDMKAFEFLYKDKVKIEILGTTPDGRNIYDVIVGNPDTDKQVVIQGGIHAREYITSLLIMKQAGEMLELYDSGTYMERTYADMLSQAAIHFVPMVNPDGIAISQFGEAAIRSPELRQGIQSCYQSDVARGGTRLDYGSYLTRWKSNAKGVDLNRNYDADWHLVGPETYPSCSGYKGPNPLSESESLALARLLQREQIKACLNYHSMGQVIYWDVAGNKQREASLALAVQYSADSGYRLLAELGRGGVKDWVQIKEPPIPSITVEVGTSAAPVPFSEFTAIWQQNYRGALRMLAFVLN